MSVETEDTAVWWFVSIVHKSSGQILRRDIDGVMASKTSEAIMAAVNRNPLRPFESFGVRQASVMQRKKCCAISDRRTKEIQDLVEMLTW
jgi:hypothetical protein